MNRVIYFGLVPFFALAAGCSGSSEPTDQSEHDFSSPQSTLVTFEFDGQLDTDTVFGNGKQEIQDQMLYTIGHLNADRGVGRLDNLALSNIQISGTHVTYHAKLPVAWWPAPHQARAEENGRVDAGGFVHLVESPQHLLVIVNGGLGNLHALALHSFGPTRAVTRTFE